MDIQQLIERFLAGYSSEHTQQAYRQDLGSWLQWCSAHDVEPIAAERHHVEAWSRQLERSSKAPSTVKRRIGTVSTWYDYLIDENVVKASPAARVRRPRVDQESRSIGLTAQQLGRLLNLARDMGSLEYLLIMLLGQLGLRIGETCRARVEHLGENQGHQVLNLPHRKGGKTGFAVLPAPVVAAVHHHVGERTRGPLLLQREQAARGVHRQTQIPYGTAYSIVKRLGAQAGVPRLHPHALRHTFATLALDAGVDIYSLQLAMGHSSSDTTARYDRARNRLDRAPSLKVADLVQETYS